MKNKPEFKVIKEWPAGPKIGTTIKQIGWGYTYPWILSNPDKAKEYVKKITKPIFITDDKVEIYDGDQYFYIDIEAGIIRKVWAYDELRNDYKPTIKRFYDFKAAEKAFNDIKEDLIERFCNFKKDSQPSISRQQLRNAIKSYLISPNNMNVMEYLNKYFNLYIE